MHSDRAQSELAAPRFERSPALLIAGFRAALTGTPATIVAPLWQHLAPFIGRIPGQIGTVCYGLCLQAEQDAAGFDYLAGCEISANTALPGEWNSAPIPAQRYAVFTHQRTAAELQDTVQSIFNDWLPASGMATTAPGPGTLRFFERYGPGFNPHTGLGDIELWLALKD